MRVPALVVLVAVALASAGCGSSRPDRSPVPAPTHLATPAAAGATLRQLGLDNGPTDLSLPADVAVERRVDQPNVVSLFFRRPSPDVALAHLRASLVGAGWRVSADGGGSLVFDDPEWTGSFTSNDGLSALVLRRR